MWRIFTFFLIGTPESAGAVLNHFSDTGLTFYRKSAAELWSSLSTMCLSATKKVACSRVQSR